MIVFLCVTCAFVIIQLGSEALISVQAVPQGIESVNGSDINMGCASPLVDRGGVMACNSSESYLVDGCSPAIIQVKYLQLDISAVVTLKISDYAQLNFGHVLLTITE